MEQQHRHLSLAVAASTAWMWGLPLFGVLQSVLNLSAEIASFFSLAFLAGHVVGYCGYATISSTSVRSKAAASSPLINAVLMVLLFFMCALSVPNALVYLCALTMGIVSAALALRWAVSISEIPTRKRGRYIAVMLFVASAIYAMVVAVFNLSPGLAYFLSALFMLMAWRMARTISPEKQGEQEHGGLRDGSKSPFRPVLFWLLFTCLLAGYYSLSWMSHQNIFSTAGQNGGLAPVAAALAYGAVALVAGTILDGTDQMEGIAMVGLAILIGTFMFVPQAAEWGLFASLDLMLQSSYGILDVFVFIYLAHMASLLGQSPRDFYAYGLSINAVVVASGYIWVPLTELPAAVSAVNLVSSMIAAALIVGTVSAIILRELRTSWQHSVDDAPREEPRKKQKVAFDAAGFTRRERDVVRLILRGLKNQQIADELRISINTVKTHIRNIYSKTDVSSRTDFILKMQEQINK